ncbi:hypothetical protein ACTQV2_09295 [Bifidobacterium thermophilum]|uniref:hypothetical protein n=1 Tax=Bifidobacterium thermophilum TaxID=33905 RepID=UPI003F91C5CB
MASVPVVSDVSSVVITAGALSIPFDDADAESTVSTVLSAAEPDVPHEASTPAQIMTAAVVATTDRIFFQAIRSVPFFRPSPVTPYAKTSSSESGHTYVYMLFANLTYRHWDIPFFSIPS